MFMSRITSGRVWCCITPNARAFRCVRRREWLRFSGVVAVHLLVPRDDKEIAASGRDVPHAQFHVKGIRCARVANFEDESYLVRLGGASYIREECYRRLLVPGTTPSHAFSTPPLWLLRLLFAFLCCRFPFPPVLLFHCCCLCCCILSSCYGRRSKPFPLYCEPS